MTTLQQINAVGTTTTYTMTLSDRDKIMAVLANPGEHGLEVRNAIHVLVAAGRSTAAPPTTWRPDTTGLSDQFQNLLELVNDTLIEVVGVDVHCLNPDVPQFVPADWADALNVRAVEDSEFRLPWVEDL